MHIICKGTMMYPELLFDKLQVPQHSFLLSCQHCLIVTKASIPSPKNWTILVLNDSSPILLTVTPSLFYWRHSLQMHKAKSS